MLWACFSVRGPEHLVQIHDIMDPIKYQHIQNQNLGMGIIKVLTVLLLLSILLIDPVL